MLKILLPVDGSDCSLRAAEYAAKLVEGKGEVLVTVLYVHYVPVPFGAVAAPVTRAQIEEAERDHSGPVVAEAERVLRAVDIPFERVTRVGDNVAQEISRYAEQSGSHAIVMGTHGGRGLSGALIGSTANKVVHLAKVPVTLVK